MHHASYHASCCMQTTKSCFGPILCETKYRQTRQEIRNSTMAWQLFRFFLICNVFKDLERLSRSTTNRHKQKGSANHMLGLCLLLNLAATFMGNLKCQTTRPTGGPAAPPRCTCFHSMHMPQPLPTPPHFLMACCPRNSLGAE